MSRDVPCGQGHIACNGLITYCDVMELKRRRRKRGRRRVPTRPHRPIDPTSDEAIAERLHLTRTALGRTTTEMCRLMGSTSGGSAWTNYEMGRRRINLDHAFRLCATCGLDLNWIYMGSKDGLRKELREKIDDLQAGRR